MIRRLFSAALVFGMTSFSAIYAQEGLTHIVQAETLKGAGNFAGAIAEYDKAIKLEPTNAEYMFRKGKTYLNMKDQDNAIMCFEKTVQLKKEYVEGHKALGLLYKKKNKLAEAVKQFDEAFKYEPDDYI